MKEADIIKLEQELAHHFQNRRLLEQAVTHSSLARELESQNGGETVADNEQLEFLGDAVLGFVTSQALFERYPQFAEGQLSKLRAHLVSEKHLVRAAKKLKLGSFLRLGRGEEKSGGRAKPALQVDALEAVLAALYLDAGFEKTRSLILEAILEPELKRLKKTVALGLPITDFKSALQEVLHTTARPQPRYALVLEEGPQHRKTFTVEARIAWPVTPASALAASSDSTPPAGNPGPGEVEFAGRGQGTTKKAAEQDAAKQALEYLWSLGKTASAGAPDLVRRFHVVRRQIGARREPRFENRGCRQAFSSEYPEVVIEPAPETQPAPPHPTVPAAGAPELGLTSIAGQEDSATAGPTDAASAAPAPLSADAELTPPATSSHRRQISDLPRLVQSLAVTMVIAVFVITFLVQAFQIPSESMENTLLIGDYLLVDKVHFAHGGIWGEILPYTPIRRGDIVVFRYPVDPNQHFVKRVIGVPGDRIRLRHKQVFRNGRPMEESYAVYRSTEPDAFRDDFPRLDVLNDNVTERWWARLHHLVHDGELVVPAGEYFVLGDNRDESLDSRYWGLVPRENIIGRPLVIYWSLRHTRRIGLLAASDRTGDKLTYFAYALRHFFQQARWGRALHVIN